MSNPTVLRQRLSKLRQEVDSMESVFAAKKVEALRRLPQEYGCASLEELILALSRLASPKLFAAVDSVVNGPQPRKRKSRAIVTPEMREDVAKIILKGGKTAREIAEAFNVSASFVTQLKTKLKATRPRSGSAAGSTR